MADGKVEESNKQNEGKDDDKKGDKKRKDSGAKIVLGEKKKGGVSMGVIDPKTESSRNALSQKHNPKREMSRMNGDKKSRVNYELGEQNADRSKEDLGDSSGISLFAGDSLIGFGKKVEVERKMPRFQNSYRLKPRRLFKSELVQKLLTMSVERELKVYSSYDSDMAPKLALSLAIQIRGEIKALAFDRYKIIVRTEVGEDKKHGYNSSVRFLIDQEHDGLATYTGTRRNLFICVTCFGLYRE